MKVFKELRVRARIELVLAALIGVLGAVFAILDVFTLMGEYR